MKKIILSLLFLTNFIYAENISVNIEIKGIKTNLGKIYMALYNNSEDYKKQKAFTRISLESKNNPLIHSLILPQGNYVFSVYQDVNNNEKLDKNFIGMPKEPVGISNFKGKGIPGSFDKLKMTIDDTNKNVLINLIELKN